MVNFLSLLKQWACFFPLFQARTALSHLSVFGLESQEHGWVLAKGSTQVWVRASSAHLKGTLTLRPLLSETSRDLVSPSFFFYLREVLSQDPYGSFSRVQPPLLLLIILSR